MVNEEEWQARCAAVEALGHLAEKGDAGLTTEGEMSSNLTTLKGKIADFVTFFITLDNHVFLLLFLSNYILRLGMLST